MSGDPRRITDDELALVYEIQKAMQNDGWPTVGTRRLVDGIASRNPPPDPDEALIDKMAEAAMSAFYHDSGRGGWDSAARAALKVVREWEADDDDD